METRSIRPEIIALDFYDGVTEGFASSLRCVGACYFKLLAWDANQDQRLFIAIPISPLVFDTILQLLNWGAIQSPLIVWLPSRVFETDKNKAEVDKIIESCHFDLTSKGMLILGDRIDSESVSMFSINDSLASAVERALRQPEDLMDWLKILNNG